jgi:outer membrane receptor protein involved in Fe transport
MSRIQLSLPALVFCLAAAPSFGQITGGSFVGIVTDPSGSILVGAQVEATNVGTNVVGKTVTNAEGYYEFPLLPTGNYILSVQQSGFRRVVTGEIELHAGTKPRIDFKMVLGQVSESVEVVSQAPLVNATTTDLGVVIDSSKVRDLPLNGRTFTQLLALEPGFNLGTSGANRGGVQFNGLPGLGNNWTLDGVDMSFGENNGSGIAAVGGSGTVINTISVEAIEEFKTSSGAFSAEYGRGTGGAINVTTKSGTNKFHGTLLEYFRNDKLDANTFFSNRSGLAKPELRHNQFGGNFGGPILKNRLFFFFNYEGDRIVRGRDITGNVASPLLLSQITNPALVQFLTDFSPSSQTPTSNPLVGFHRRNDAQRVSEDTSLSRIDANLGRHRLSGRLVWNSQLVSNPQLSPVIHQLLPVPVKNWAFSDYIVISPTMSNEMRFGYNHYPISRHIAADNPDNNTFVPGVGYLTKDGRGFSAPGLTGITTVDSLSSDTPTYMGVDNFTWIRGAHTFKTGFEIRSTDSKRTQFGGNVVHMYNSIPDLINDNIFSLELDFGNPGRGYAYYTYAGYFQDEWKVNRRIQLNLGLRYEYYTVFSGSIGLATADPFGPRTNRGDPIWEPDRNNFAPRVGVAIDLTGKGKTVLRMGGGITYGPPQPFYYYDDAWIDARVPSFPVVNVVDIPASFKPVHFPFPNSFLQDVRDDPSKLPSGLVPGLLAPDRNRRDEYSGQWNISLQHALTNTLAVQAAYVGNRALKLYQGALLNPIDGKSGIRPHADIGPAWLQENAGRSWHHGLQVSVRQRMTKGLTLDAYYTFSKTMQYGAADSNFQKDGLTQDFGNIAGSVGLTPGEVKHRLTVVHSYALPTPGFAKQFAAGRLLTAGWTLQGIMDVRSGQPLNITIGRDVVGNGQGGPQRPDAVSGVDQRLHASDRLVWLNPAAYDASAPSRQARFGNLGFNTGRGPGAFSWDLAIHKTFPIGEQQRLMFRFEMFNWLNHFVPGNPVTTLSDPTFGTITGAAANTTARNIQFAMKYSF